MAGSRESLKHVTMVKTTHFVHAECNKKQNSNAPPTTPPLTSKSLPLSHTFSPHTACVCRRFPHFGSKFSNQFT